MQSHGKAALPVKKNGIFQISGYFLGRSAIINTRGSLLLSMRPMRRQASRLPDAEARKILETGIWGTLATADSGGQPYAVPLNYALAGDTLYLHSAVEGHKIENLRENPLISFSVVASTEVLAERFDMKYCSVTVFGTARFVEDPAEKQSALECLMEKYAPAFHDQAMDYIRRNTDRTAVIAIAITGISGKTGQ